jgi:rod shape-determining protein MreC
MLDIRRRTGILFGVVCIAQVILISAQVQTKSGVRVLESVSFGVFARVQQFASATVFGVRDFWGNYVALRGARVENESLRKQVAELEVRLQEQRAVAARAVKLQALLELKQSVQAPTLAADVIAGNPTPGVMTITIDRGSADGVQESMAVIAPRGIVGRVIAPVARHAARVQLIIDRNAAAAALIERTRAGGIVVGHDGDPPLRMENVSNLDDVQGGDVVVTSGIDGIYPKGFVIGTVESSERGKTLYRDISVRPSVEFRGLEEVLVVMVPPRPAQEEQAPATPAPAGASK